MSRVNLAELRRLHQAVAFASDEWDDSARGIYNALPAILDELEAAREAVSELKADYQRLEEIRRDLMERCERMRPMEGLPLDEIAARQITRDRHTKAIGAAAKNLLARIHRDGGHHTEAVGFSQSVADAGDRVSEWLLAAEERDALRAELAAAKERGDGLYLGLRQTLEALGGVAQPGVSEAFLILGVPGEAAAIKRLNTALAADNARLRAALEKIAAKVDFAEVRRLLDEQWVCRLDACQASRATYGELENIHTALAATTAHSLAAHDAALLREVREKIRELTKLSEGTPNIIGVRAAMDILRSEADRREQEAQRG